MFLVPDFKGFDFFPHGTRLDFMKWKGLCFSLSMIAMAMSLGLFLVKGLNYGVDFKGGSLIEVQSKSGPADLGAVRERVGGLGLGDVQVQSFGAPTDVLIRVEEQPGGDKAQQDALNKVVTALGDGFTQRRVEVVGPAVSSELRTTGIVAVLASLLAIITYVWFRFEWQFGVGGLFALVHDVSLTLGMFALFQLEFSLQIVAAILAIIGYSLNDTIVVYDRIRENLKRYRKMPLPELLDLSVNETLARTVMTSLTLLIALIPLLLLGPESLFGLTAAITLGIFVGTYSSIYMAAPLLVWLGVTSNSFVPTESAAERQEKIARGEA